MSGEEKKRVRTVPTSKIKLTLQSLMEGEEDMKKAIEKAWNKLDTNGSGFLEKEEFREAINLVLVGDGDEEGIGEKQFNSFFDKVDKDADGKISKDEWFRRAKGLFKRMEENIDNDDENLTK
ncbi:parvalbumin alpha-like [Branchiostoma lanceolatum]|uniref:Hypp1704 protein n=1 Tax=Branchiostoma lanceolatum TaxID=7740 RepID=A0A8J9ZLX5_BRALA|nr:Hypp1704 [Branchiostoma lanceolatum]